MLPEQTGWDVVICERPVGILVEEVDRTLQVQNNIYQTSFG